MRRWLQLIFLLWAASAFAYAPEPKPLLRLDAANRLWPLGHETRVTYNNRGLISTIREPSGQWTTNFYDAAKGRLTNRVDAVASTVYRYDANNNVTNVVEAGKTNAWTLDAYDRVSSYRDADGNLIQYRYDANGNLTNLIYPGGKVVTYFYDSLNRLTNVTDWANRKTTIEYDLASRVCKIVRPNGTVREINYDAAGQTTNIIERLTNNAPIAFFRLNWNNAARVEWEFAAPLPQSNTPPTRVMTHDDDNRIATFNGNSVTHDLDGNMTSGPGTNNTFISYAYDARNRLLSAGGVSYGYDPAGHRISVAQGGETNHYVVNPNAALSQVLIRTKPDGSKTFYVYGLGLLYDVNETSGVESSTRFYHYDYRGSTVALTDGNGIPTDYIQYSAYGTITFHVGSTDTPFLFNGRYGVQTDPNGLLYMRARYYNPYVCRFINADPAGFAGGLNFYAFAGGNPVSLFDPFGLGPGSEGFFSWLSGAAAGFAVDGAWGAASGLWHMATHPSQTASALWNAATHPAQTLDAFWNGFLDFGERILDGDPRAFRQIAFEAATAMLPVGSIKYLDDLADLGKAAKTPPHFSGSELYTPTKAPSVT